MKLKDILIKPINKKINLSIYEVIMITIFVIVVSNGLYYRWWGIYPNYNTIHLTNLLIIDYMTDQNI
jgi:hypothetical protein